LASLAAVANALSRSTSLRDCLQLCAAGLVDGLDVAFARIWTLNEQTNVLELQASAGLYTHLDGPHSRVAVGALKIGQIALERKPHLTNSVIGDPRVSDQQWAEREGMVAFAGYPLVISDRVVGVMALFSRRSLSTETLDILSLLADSIAQAIIHWRTVDALRISEERFNLAVQGSAEGLFDLNVLTYESYVAPRFKELLGYQEHEIECTYAQWESWLHPDDRDRTLTALHQHLEQRIPYQVEYRMLTKSGEYRWFQARGQALWNEQGQAVRLAGSIGDITERKRSQHKNSQLASIVESSSDAIFSTSLDGVITSWNRGAVMTFGYEESEILGRSVGTLIPPERAHEMMQILGRIAQGENIEHFESVACGKRGDRINLSMTISPVLDSESKLIGTSTIARDITERKRTEESLQMMRFSVDHVGYAVFWCSRDGKILYVNAKACSDHGFTREELLEMTVSDLDVEPDYQPGRWEQHFEDLKHRSTILLETRHRAKDGRLFPVEVNANYVQIGDQEFNFAFVRDITERKQAEIALFENERLLRLALGVLDLTAFRNDRDLKFSWMYRPSDGLIREPVIGKTDADILPPEYAETVLKIKRRVLESGQSTREEVQSILDGKLRHYEMNLEPIWSDNAVVGLIGVALDITERKEAERALRLTQFSVDRAVDAIFGLALLARFFM
jgi:PAS domain S-box-containing protein